MSLTTAEVARVKHELGYNVLLVGAEPYVGISTLFETAIAPYTQSGALTTSSTAVTAATTPTLVTLTLADATGFAAGARVVVDVDSLQESATVRSMSGSAITLLLSNAHSGTYPVTVEGGESIIRAILRQIQAISGLGSNTGELQSAMAAAGIKRVNEIEFFGGEASGATTRIRQLEALLAYWRDELSIALNVENRRGAAGGYGGGSDVAIY